MIGGHQYFYNISDNSIDIVTTLTDGTDINADLAICIQL